MRLVHAINPISLEKSRSHLPPALLRRDCFLDQKSVNVLFLALTEAILGESPRFGTRSCCQLMKTSPAVQSCHSRAA